MGRGFQTGDILIFQLESGFGLLKILAIDRDDNGIVWHLSAYEDLFLDSEMADLALETVENLRVGTKHLALTNRAFESTQTAKMTNFPVTEAELAHVNAWRDGASRKVHDTSVRLLLGLR